MPALTKADAVEALQLYGQHHPDCAAVWPEKPCDCGLAALGVNRPMPRIEQNRTIEVVVKRKDWARDPAPRSQGAPGRAERPGFRNGVANVQPRNVPKPRPKPLVVIGTTDTHLAKTCTACGERFLQPRRHGRPFSKCPSCR